MVLVRVMREGILTETAPLGLPGARIWKIGSGRNAAINEQHTALHMKTGLKKVLCTPVQHISEKDGFPTQEMLNAFEANFKSKK